MGDNVWATLRGVSGEAHETLRRRVSYRDLY